MHGGYESNLPNYLHKKSPETSLLHTSCTIKTHEAVWPLKQEPHVPPLLERLQKPDDRCLVLSSGVWLLHTHGSLPCILLQDMLNNWPKGIKPLTHHGVVLKLLDTPEYTLSGSELPSHPQPLKSEGRFTHRADIPNRRNPEVTSKRLGHTLPLS